MKLLTNFYSKAFLLMATGFLLTTCTEDEAVQEPDPLPQITSMEMTMTPNDEGRDAVFRYSASAGQDTGTTGVKNDSIFDNTTYSVRLELFEDDRNVSNYVGDRANKFQVFYVIDPGLEVQFDYTDSDVHGRPLGLHTQLGPTAPGQGNLEIILVANPDKDAQGAKEGDHTNAGGDELFRAEFTLVIQ